MKSSTIDLAFIKFVQGGSQRNSQCCINECTWTSANKIWIPMIKKVTPSWTESSLLMKHGSTITSRIVNGRLWNGNIHNRPSGKSSKAILNSFLGLTRPSTGTLSGQGFKNKQCSLQWDAYSQTEAWNLKPSTYCCPHSWNLPETQVWGIGSPFV